MLILGLVFHVQKEYFNDINPLFDELTKLKNDEVLWRNIDNKEQRFYIPILQAFVEELNRLNTANSGIIPSRLLYCVLGKNDFYKVITYDRRKNTSAVFNLYAALNRSSGVSRPLVNVLNLRCLLGL